MKDRTLKKSVDRKRKEGIARRNMHSIYHHHHLLLCLHLISSSVPTITYDITVFGSVVELESDSEFLNGHIVH